MGMVHGMYNQLDMFLGLKMVKFATKMTLLMGNIAPARHCDMVVS